MIAAIVLAAGTSSRMGRPKLLLRLGGKSLLRRTIETLDASPVGDIVVVVSGEIPALADELANTRARLVENHDYRAGMSTSIRSGLAAVRDHTRAVLITPADLPFLTTSAVSRLVDEFQRGSKPVAIVEAGGIKGAPAIFDRSVFHLLEDLTGDVGAREIVRSHPELVQVVQFEEAYLLYDVDTWQEFEVAAGHFQGDERVTGRDKT